MEEKKERKKVKDKLLALLCYLGILVFVPLILKPKSDFVRFHLRQGITIFALEVILLFIAIIPLVGLVLAILGWLIAGFLSLVGLIQVIRGKYYKIPLINFLADKFKIIQ